jgi:hypothetical protein
MHLCDFIYYFYLLIGKQLGKQNQLPVLINDSCDIYAAEVPDLPEKVIAIQAIAPGMANA